MAELSIRDSRVFDDGSLWGYMNGGADLYLEYGFKSLEYQQFRIGELNFKLELYTMEDPEGAFGIYSVNHLKCLTEDSLFCISCLNNFQLQAVKGNCYLNLMAMQSSSLSQQMMLQVMTMLLEKIPDQEIRLPDALLKFHSGSNSLTPTRLYRGKVGVDNNLFEWSEVVRGLSAFRLWKSSRSEHPELSLYILETDDISLLKALQKLNLPIDQSIMTIEREGAKLTVTKEAGRLTILEAVHE